MFEKKHHPLVPFHIFLRRTARHFFISSSIVFAALTLGVIGYHLFAQFTWIDSILNASMILTGMGPVGELKTVAAKLWSSAYALFSGLVFITSIGIAAGPIVHRLLHKFHLQDDDSEGEAS